MLQIETNWQSKPLLLKTTTKVPVPFAVVFLGGGEGFGEAGARLCVGLLVDRAQVALDHAHRDAELLGDLFKRTFVLGHGHEHVDFARGESVVGDEGDVARGHKRKRDARRGERAHVIGRTAHAGPEDGHVHARCQLSKRGGKERDEKARAQRMRCSPESRG